MGVDDELDVLGLEAAIDEALEERPRLLVPEREQAPLAVADARVDDHRSTLLFDDERLDAQRDVALRVRVVGNEPLVAGHGLGCRLGEEERRWDVVGLLLDDARDGDLAHRPALGVGRRGHVGENRIGSVCGPKIPNGGRHVGSPSSSRLRIRAARIGSASCISARAKLAPRQ